MMLPAEINSAVDSRGIQKQCLPHLLYKSWIFRDPYLLHAVLNSFSQHLLMKMYIKQNIFRWGPHGAIKKMVVLRSYEKVNLL